MHTGVTKAEVWNYIAYSCYTCEVSIMLHKLRFGILSDSYRGLDPYWCSLFMLLSWGIDQKCKLVGQLRYGSSVHVTQTWCFSILLDNTQFHSCSRKVYFHVIQVKLSEIYKIFHLVKFWSMCFLLQQLRFKYIMHIHVTQLRLQCDWHFTYAGYISQIWIHSLHSRYAAEIFISSLYISVTSAQI
jgi:hypothetical protein